MAASAPLADVMITLGARDLPALRSFYRRLGWPQIIDEDDFAAFQLRGVVLALFPVVKLARDGNTEAEHGTGGIRFSIGVMLDTADEVDRLTDQMRQAGARVTKEPVDAATTSRSPGPNPIIRSRPAAPLEPDTRCFVHVSH